MKLSGDREMLSPFWNYPPTNAWKIGVVIRLVRLTSH